MVLVVGTCATTLTAEEPCISVQKTGFVCTIVALKIINRMLKIIYRLSWDSINLLCKSVKINMTYSVSNPARDGLVPLGCGNPLTASITHNVRLAYIYLSFMHTKPKGNNFPHGSLTLE